MMHGNEEVELDDDALDIASGGIVLQTGGTHSSNTGYSVNSTIYFQTTLNDTVTS